MEKSNIIDILEAIAYIIFICAIPYVSITVSLQICHWLNLNSNTSAVITVIIGFTVTIGLIIMCIRNLQKIWKEMFK